MLPTQSFPNLSPRCPLTLEHPTKRAFYFKTPTEHGGKESKSHKDAGRTRTLQTFLSWQEATLDRTVTTGNPPCPASQHQGTESCLEDIIQPSQTQAGQIP